MRRKGSPMERDLNMREEKKAKNVKNGKINPRTDESTPMPHAPSNSLWELRWASLVRHRGVSCSFQRDGVETVRKWQPNRSGCTFLHWAEVEGGSRLNGEFRAGLQVRPPFLLLRNHQSTSGSSGSLRVPVASCNPNIFLKLTILDSTSKISSTCPVPSCVIWKYLHVSCVFLNDTRHITSLNAKSPGQPLHQRFPPPHWAEKGYGARGVRGCVALRCVGG